MALYGDGTRYGDGTKYIDSAGTTQEYVAEQEVHCHRLSLRVRYTATLIPGAYEAFKLYDARPRLAPDSQRSFSHEAFVDATTPSERLSCVVRHAGSELVLYNLQLIAQPKKHQPKG